MKNTLTFMFVVFIVLTIGAGSLAADEPNAGAINAKAFSDMVERGIKFLSDQGQAEDGSFASKDGPGVTSIVLTGILAHGRSPDDPVVTKGLKYLEKNIQPDGGIYQPESQHGNYETSLALMAFAAANKSGKYTTIIKKAEKYLRENQWDEENGHDHADPFYGGAGYGRSKRPDLSNTNFFIDALHASGADADDEAMKKALVFVSRCQNFESEYNSLPYAAKNPDGGFFYTCAAGGASMAGKTDEGGLVSYGSMTYAGLKSMIYAGVKKDDPRVKAAVKWIQSNYNLKVNPGMGTAGLYYYYNTLSKALEARGEEFVIDSKGEKHSWRAELAAELASKQKPDGSWLNDNAQWMEGNPNLVTAYVLLSLSRCRGEK